MAYTNHYISQQRHCEVCKTICQTCAACILCTSMDDLSSKIDVLAICDVASRLKKLLSEANTEDVPKVEDVANKYWQAEAKIITTIRNAQVYGEKMVKASLDFRKYGDIEELAADAEDTKEIWTSVSQCIFDLENIWRTLQGGQPLPVSSPSIPANQQEKHSEDTTYAQALIGGAYAAGGYALGSIYYVGSTIVQGGASVIWKIFEVLLRMYLTTKDNQEVEQTTTMDGESGFEVVTVRNKIDYETADLETLMKHMGTHLTLLRETIKSFKADSLEKAVKVEMRIYKNNLSQDRIQNVSRNLEQSSQKLVDTCKKANTLSSYMSTM